MRAVRDPPAAFRPEAAIARRGAASTTPRPTARTPASPPIPAGQCPSDCLLEVRDPHSHGLFDDHDLSRSDPRAADHQIGSAPQIKNAKETALLLVAAMTRHGRMARSRIVNRMRCRRASLRCDVLRAPQMHRRFTGNFGSEAETNAAVIATFVGHRAHRVALGMIAGSSAWTASVSGSGNCDDAHVFKPRSLFCANLEHLDLPSRSRLELLTICSKIATYS